MFYTKVNIHTKILSTGDKIQIKSNDLYGRSYAMFDLLVKLEWSEILKRQHPLLTNLRKILDWLVAFSKCDRISETTLTAKHWAKYYFQYQNKFHYLHAVFELINSFVFRWQYGNMVLHWTNFVIWTKLHMICFMSKYTEALEYIYK